MAKKKQKPKSKNPSHNLSVDVRVQLWEDAGKMCHYCDKPVKKPGTKGGRSTHFDHKVSKAHLGTLDLENLLCCCRACNFAKGKKSYAEFIEYELRKAGKKYRRLRALHVNLCKSN